MALGGVCMPIRWLYPTRVLVVCADALAVVGSYLLAYLFRFDFSLPAVAWGHFYLLLPLVVALKLAVFIPFGLYRGMWRYTGFLDLWRLARANLVAQLLVVAAAAYLTRFEGGVSRGVFIIDGALCLLLTAGVRLLIRVYFLLREESSRRGVSLLAGLLHRPAGQPVLIVGAGEAGGRLAAELMASGSLGYRPVGFVDDDAAKIGRRLQGLPVLGSLEDLPALVQRFSVVEVLIALPSAAGEGMRRVVRLCERAGAPYKTLPTLGELMDGRVSVSALRRVDYQDLLGRPQVSLDHPSLERAIAGGPVLVTGAGGSIGAELCRQLVRFKPSRLLLLDSSEYNLFSVQHELAGLSPGTRLVPILGRVQDRGMMRDLLAAHHPGMVLHAAAYKHVHLVEQSPWEGVFNNVVGSRVAMEESLAAGVERFVLVSTDKAVRPAGVMGACKRAAELLMQTMGGGPTRFMAVRFGNVVGSSGSVIPLFREQIERGGPVTVTHPEATRFFMTIPEAASLILQAGVMGAGGEIFVLQMGTPVRILEMAEDLIRLSGREPYRDVDIVFTGLRPGEKLYEELVTAGEGMGPTWHRKIMVLRPDGAEGAGPERRALVVAGIEGLCRAASAHRPEAVRRALMDLVPEYRPQSPPADPIPPRPPAGPEPAAGPGPADPAGLADMKPKGNA